MNVSFSFELRGLRSWVDHLDFENPVRLFMIGFLLEFMGRVLGFVSWRTPAGDKGKLLFGGGEARFQVGAISELEAQIQDVPRRSATHVGLNACVLLEIDQGLDAAETGPRQHGGGALKYLQAGLLQFRLERGVGQAPVYGALAHARLVGRIF